MAEVTVRVCDLCKERLAIGQCPICGRDVCKQCTQAFSLELGMKWRGPSIEFFRENICVDCAKKLEGKSKDIILELSKKLQPEIRDLLKQYAKG